MSLLGDYFMSLLAKVEASDLTNQDTDKGGFFKPTRTIVIRNLKMLIDLHEKPRAREMLRAAWKTVVEELPPEALVMTEEQKTALRQMLGDAD